MEIAIAFILIVIAAGVWLNKPLQITITHKLVQDTPAMPEPPKEVDEEIKANLTDLVSSIQQLMLGGEIDDFDERRP